MLSEKIQLAMEQKNVLTDKQNNINYFKQQAIDYLFLAEDYSPQLYKLEFENFSMQLLIDKPFTLSNSFCLSKYKTYINLSNIKLILVILDVSTT